MKTYFSNAAHLIDNSLDCNDCSLRENFEIYLNLQSIYVESISFSNDAESFVSIRFSETSRDVTRCDMITTENVSYSMHYICRNKQDIRLVYKIIKSLVKQELKNKQLFSV